MNRRQVMMGMLQAVAAAQTVSTRRYRVALIGATGRGNYGHDWETTWNNFSNVDVVALADADPKGRAAAARKSRARKTYADYREMLTAEKPDIVTICPRWLDQRVEMLTAAAEAGAHILMEKPFARSLPEADRMIAVLERLGRKLQLGHTARVVGVTREVRDMLRRGELGTLLEIRARGKEDRRAGGEDMMVLGTHAFDLMRYFAGDPEWVFATIYRNGKEVTRDMLRQPTEPVGKVAGDEIQATFRFHSGVPGYFASKASDVPKSDRFGVTLYGSKAAVCLPLSDVPSAEPYIARSPAWVDARWERLPYPKGTETKERSQTNAMMAADLMDAIEKNREPVCSARDGLWTIELVAGVYQSHFSTSRVAFPLKDRSAGD